EKEDLAGKVRKLERADMEAQQDLLAQIEKMKEKNVALAGDLAQERTRVSDEASEMGKTIARLQVDLKEAQNAKGAIEEQMASDQVRVKELDGEVQWMQRERKKFNETLAELTKKIEDQEREAKYDKQFLEQKVKNAKADRRMFEAKVENLKTQTTESEAKFRAAEDGLKMSAAQSSLQESQIIVLREEKSKLERKLIRYISKIIDDDDAHGKAGKKKAAGDGQASLAGEKMQTKEEIAEQKLKLHYNLALAYDRRGMYKKEEREYIKCLKINPNDANVHYNLAILYDDKLNYNNKAVKHYEIFLKLRPSGTDVEKVKDWMLYAEQEDRLGAEMK
ncbi:MAG: tetratricopeptide repeat protein, partial [Hyphomicrobiaceae bacterium]|nr:tetratricopeptide repeat protein [Hyphomicrobiaceae bacterium]